jgi:LPXTG-motif cell wall-anchored protein
MRHLRSSFLVCAGIGIVSLVSAPVSAQQKTSSTETRQFEIVSVDGNKVVVRGQKGAQELTVPPDFQLTVDGKPVGVSELKPGMKGTATITTTTTTTPVYVTEIKNGEVMKVVGNSIIVRTPTGIRMFSEGDVDKRGVKIMKDGKPVNFSDLHERDRLTATIVTAGQPKVMTERQVAANMSSPAAPAASAAPAAPRSTPTAAPAAPAAAAGTTGAAAPARKLPKTASMLPLVGLVGAASLGLGVILTVRRRRLV